MTASSDSSLGRIDTPVRLTIEITWMATPAAGEDVPVEVEMTEGKVVEVVAWPVGSGNGPEPRPGGGWRLGVERSGRVRARVEAPLAASLVFRTAGQAVRMPLLAVLDGSQHTPPQAPVEIGVERLPWDALAVGLVQGDGTAAPGTKVPVSVGFNILTPEPTDLAVRTTAELRPLRGGEPVWRADQQEVVTSNRLYPPARIWDVVAPTAEGTYELEVRSSWEPVAVREGSRLGRLIRRRRTPSGASAATRRVTLAVVGTKPTPVEPVPAGRSEQDVDALDLARLRGHRLIASGRSPVAAPGRVSWFVPDAALVEPTRRDRLRGWIVRAGPEASHLAPSDGSGLTWSAIGLKVAHPGQPHRLTLKVIGGHPSTLGVAVIDLDGAGGRPRVVLDACASGPPILQDGLPVTFSWLVWPDTAEPVLVLINRGTTAPVQLESVTLTELADLPAGPSVIEPGTDPRTLGLYLASPGALDRFGPGGDDGNPGDALTLARRLTRYAAYCGATAVVLPEALSDRPRRQALDGQAAEDAVGPDRLDLLLRILGRQGCVAWLELSFAGALPGLPAPDSPEALARGLVRVDRHGRPDGPVYHPLHPDVRAALRRRVAEAVAPRQGLSSLTGLLIRLGPGPTLLGGPDTGLDDLSYARFVRETFDAETAQGIAGLGADDPNRFAARAQFVAGSGRMPWLTWRSRGITALYAELAEAARKAAPGVTLAVATPGLDDGPVGNEARRADLAGLAPTLAWRAVGLDLDDWPTGMHAPIVLRGVSISPDDLAHDLATSPELDLKVASQPSRGLLLDMAGEADDKSPMANRQWELSNSTSENRKLPGGPALRLTAAPQSEGSAGDEALGHAVAALDARWVVLSVTAVAGHEEPLRRFAQIFRALPAPAGGPPPERRPFGVAVRALGAGDTTYLALANDTPYPILLETVLAAPASAALEDLGRKLRLTPKSNPEGVQLVLELPPYGVHAIRVGAPQAKVGAVTLYPSEAVATSMQARYTELSTQLARLNQAAKANRPAPPNPGFEPNTAHVVQLSVAQGPVSPNGWKLVGSPANSAEIDLTQFHAGRGSLKLSAAEPPVSVVSESFTPDLHSTMTVQAWFRSSRPDAKLRLWIEGESARQPYVRRSELTVQPEWGPQAVRASDVPLVGLDSARLRFELLTGGSVWVDDLTVTGETLTDTERRNACRTLMAAMHAYREKQFADFARLARSHWARRSGALTGAPSETTALPSDRKLR